MLRLTLAQLRHGSGRLGAAGIAVALGTAFVALMILAGTVLSGSSLDAIAARYAQADLIVKGSAFSEDDLEELRATEGVAAADAHRQSVVTLGHGNATVYQVVMPTSSDDRLSALRLTEGQWPLSEGDIAISQASAERLGVGLGESVSIDRWVANAAGDDIERLTVEGRVSGIVTDENGAYDAVGDVAVIDAEVFSEWQRQERLPVEGPPSFEELVVLVEDGIGHEEAREAVSAALGVDSVNIVTPHEHAEQVAAQFSGGENLVYSVFIVGFSVIALVVAGLVISNTFAVLVAQRTHSLALLRAVGAGRGQIRGSVLLEAAALGAVAASAGVLLAVVLGQVALWILRTVDIGISVPAAVPLSWQAVLLPLAAGVVVTIVAAAVPARIATRVPPVAALRPLDAQQGISGTPNRARIVLAASLTVVGLGLLGWGVRAGHGEGDVGLGLLLGLSGGLLSFVGVVVSAVFWVPRVTSTAGRLVAFTGTTTRLASANTMRNPRRTAVTSTALLIGVTLVTMLSTGAASARPTVAAAMDARYPVDVQVISTRYDEAGVAALLPEEIAAVRGAEGLAAVATMGSTRVTLPERGLDEDGWVVAADQAVDSVGEIDLGVQGIDPVTAREVLRDQTLLAELTEEVLLVSHSMADGWSLTDGQGLLLDGPSGSQILQVRITDMELTIPLTSQAALAELDADASVIELWASIDPDADVGAVITALRDALAGSVGSVYVAGSAAERVYFDGVIDAVLAVVIGLIAVSVVIALIGVANTLALSVHERRRESATLRALGLTVGQMRRMLAIEGVLIAAVGAVLGVALGLLYGWAGSLTVLGVVGEVTLAVPWADVAVVGVVAVIAGLLASVIPGRAAARMSPVSALGVS